jgi:hypothetical protein
MTAQEVMIVYHHVALLPFVDVALWRPVMVFSGAAWRVLSLNLTGHYQ